MFLVVIALTVGVGLYLPRAWKLDKADRAAERARAMADHPAGRGLPQGW